MLANELNRFMVGWTGYFNHSNASETYNHLQRFVEWKFAKFICFRHHYTKLSFRLGGFLECYKYGLTKLTGRISYARPSIAVR
jgi:Group II intron, maturase-specific domain